MNIQNTKYVIDDNTQFGGFWIRLLAYLIDGVVLLIPSLLISFLVSGDNYIAPTYEISPDLFFEDMFYQIMLAWVYEGALVSSSWQATVGKRVLGLKVVDENGDRLSFGRATGRYFAKFLSSLILLIGFLMIGWTNRKRGLHDMVADTLVIKSNNNNA